MGDSRRLIAMGRAVIAALAAFACMLAAPGLAAAFTTRVVAPGASKKADPCVVATPCEYIWAVESSTFLDVVQFESGEYDYSGAANEDLTVPTGVTLEQAPDDTTRPLIKQTVAFPKCNCPTVSLDGEDVVRDLEIYQASAGFSTGAGALAMPPNSLVERSILIGVKNGMYFFSGGASSGGVRDSLVLGEAGYGVEVLSGQANLDNVTAIARNGEPGKAVALLTVASFGKASTIEATNTVARGQAYDAEAHRRKNRRGRDRQAPLL